MRLIKSMRLTTSFYGISSEDALMELFDKCENCGKDGTFIKKVVIGTFVRLKQTCNNCDHMREWDSQPFVKNIYTSWKHSPFCFHSI